MDFRETDRFLHRIYEHGDEFEVLYLDGDGTVRRLTKTFISEGHQDSDEFMLEVQRAEAAGFNVYVSAMPLAMQKGAFDRIWIDQDDPAADQPFARGENPWPAPTTMVKTSDGEGGYRWQAIWLLANLITPSEAKAAMVRLAKEIGADVGVHDARRVLRLAGVQNAKRGSQARLMSTADGRIGLDAFGSLAVAEENPLAEMLNATIQNPNHVLGEFIDGVTKGERNRKAYMAAKHLKNAAVGYDDAAAFLKLGASRCDPTMDDRELEHALNSAYHRGA